MKHVARTSDHAMSPRGSGPGISGSSNVLVDGRPILRDGDEGVDQKGKWHVAKGARHVLVNNRETARCGDLTDHGEEGRLVTGSPFVLVGEIDQDPNERKESAVAVRISDHAGKPLRGAVVQFKKEGEGYVTATITEARGRTVAWRREGGGYQPRVEGWVLIRKAK